MTIESFKEYVKSCKPLNTEEIHCFMDDMSNEARRFTFRLNASYHTPAEVRNLLSELLEVRFRLHFAYFLRSILILGRI